MKSAIKSRSSYISKIPRILLVILLSIFTLLIHTETIESSYSPVYILHQETNTAPVDIGYTIKEWSLFLTPDMLEGDKSMLRNFLIRQLIAQWFTDFVTFPYAWSWNNAITSISMWSWYEVISWIHTKDDIDQYIELTNFWSWTFDVFHIDEDIRKNWWPIYLFKNTQDLLHMWYEVVSHRTRINIDEEYRRFNIAQSFSLLWHVRILLPWESLDFMMDAKYDHAERTNYVEWYAIIDGEEEKSYAGGMCWASTAIYQWILTNKWLQVTKLRNHSKRFSNLYNATINHKPNNIPWIDSGVYYGQIDLVMKNTTPHPIVLVMNYDWSYWWEEEVFTLSLKPTKWTFSFVQWWKSWKTEEIEDPSWTWTIIETINAWWCYTRLINGEKQTSCYKEVR